MRKNSKLFMVKSIMSFTAINAIIITTLLLSGGLSIIFFLQFGHSAAVRQLKQNFSTNNFQDKTLNGTPFFRTTLRNLSSHGSYACFCRQKRCINPFRIPYHNTVRPIFQIRRCCHFQDIKRKDVDVINGVPAFYIFMKICSHCTCVNIFFHDNGIIVQKTSFVKTAHAAAIAAPSPLPWTA